MPTLNNDTVAKLRRVVNAEGKSEWRVGRRGLKVVEELAARGVAVATIARALHMGKDAFRNVRDRQPEVQEAPERGRAREHDALVAAFTRARWRATWSRASSS